MLEQFKLKSCPTVTVMKIIGFLLSLTMTAAFVFAFYPIPEKYDTAADVRESKAFNAVVDAAKQARASEISYIGSLSFRLRGISWIYTASLDSYTVYSKIDYTVGGESKTAYFETYCGDTYSSNAGFKFSINSKKIDAQTYISQNSHLINYEQTYNDLAVSTVSNAMNAKSHK